MTSSTPTENGTTLRGWFLKEKQDKFKRRQSIVSGSTTTKRWFQIERLGSGENALCYYKRTPKQDEQPTGFFFLNDIISISQDKPKKMITLEHPSRILRLESPSLAQHTHSYSALVRSCPNAQTNSSSLAEISNSTPSHSFYGSSSSSSLATAKNSSGGGTTTAKDELAFLREITGNSNVALSDDSSSESGIHDTSESSSESEKENAVPLLTSEREEEEEKTAVEPLYYRGNGKEDDGVGEAFRVEMLKAVLPSVSNEIPKSSSFGSHQIQRSSSYRLHFGDDDIQPDEDFLDDDWDD